MDIPNKIEVSERHLRRNDVAKYVVDLQRSLLPQDASEAGLYQL